LSDREKFDDFYFKPDKVRDSTSVWDIFWDEFDITWAQSQEYSKSKHFTVNPAESQQFFGTEDDGEVTYDYNSDWFRSDEFTTEHPEKYHIVFSGCSETEGVGSPLETVWAKLLHTKLKQRFDIGGYYNLAKSGQGWHKVISSLLVYIKKYGKPTHLFVLLPNVARDYVWREDRQSWNYEQKLPFTSNKKHLPKEMLDQVTTLDEYRDAFIHFTLGWKLFEAFCNASDIKLVCSTWNYEESENNRFHNHNPSFFSLDKPHFEEYAKQKRPDGKFKDRDLRRRDNHSGVLYHEWWADSFMQQILERGLFDD
jgi:hypothetical protein